MKNGDRIGVEVTPDGLVNLLLLTEELVTTHEMETETEVLVVTLDAEELQELLTTLYEAAQALDVVKAALAVDVVRVS